MRTLLFLAAFLLPFVVFGGSASAIAPITSALTEISGEASQIKTAILTILGVLVTVGLAWAIVKGLQK